MREETTVTVEDVEYTVRHFGAIEGLKIGTELAKKAAPVIAPMVEMATGEGITGAMAEKVAGAIVEHVDAEETTALILRLLSQTTATGTGVLDARGFDVHFRGRLHHLPPVIAAVVRHNFADFFSKMLAMKDVARAAVTTP